MRRVNRVVLSSQMREQKRNRKIRYIVLPSYCQSGVTDSVNGREQENDGVTERWGETEEKRSTKSNFHPMLVR